MIKSLLASQAPELITNPKLAASVITATWWSGTATYFHWLPSTIGVIATAVGIVLTLVLIRSHIKKARRDEEKHKLDIALLKAQLADINASSNSKQLTEE